MSEVAAFDWYAASIDAPPQDVIASLEAAYDPSGYGLVDVKATTPRSGYERAFSMVKGSDLLCKVQFGGVATGSRVWACGTGDRAPAFAKAVRESFPEHRVLRLDVALDYDEEGAWDSLSALAIHTADVHGLKVRHIGDYHRCEDGRSLYIGSRSSAACQRLYEKGKQQGLDASPTWVRQELELKPQTDIARLAYSTATPEECYQATKWTRYVWETLFGPTLAVRPAPAGSIRKLSDDDRALAFMFRQYGGVLRRKLEALGGDVQVFSDFVLQGILEASTGSSGSDEGAGS